jgi:cobalt/nickel transport system permease protein
MHIPDGFLSGPVWLGLDALSVPAVGYVARQAQRHFEESRVPLLGVMGAFVFAAQMINFPVGAGTSAHLVGGALLAVLLGPAAASVVMTAILAIQAFVFQDGGVLALGANVANMALAGVLAGYLPYHFLGGGRLRKLAIFLGGALSVLVSGALALAELSASHVAMPAGLLALSAGLFTINAAAEGAITVAVVAGIEALSPGLVRQRQAARDWAPGMLAITAMLLATVGALFASATPDAIQNLTRPGGSAAGWFERAAGVVVVFAACVLIARLFSRRRTA